MTNNNKTDFELCLEAVLFHVGDFFGMLVESITGKKVRSNG